MTARIQSRLGLAALTLILTFAAAEVVVRAFRLGPDVFRLERGMLRLSGNPHLRYTLVPGFQSADGSVSINRLGYRGPEPANPEAADPDTLRIALIGDSIAFGMGAMQEALPALQLEQALRERGRIAEVTGFGVPGYNILQVAETLATAVPPTAPDRVVYLYCLNDPQAYSRELEALLAERPSATRKAVEARWQHGPRIHSRLLELARLALVDTDPPAQRPPRARSDDAMQQLLTGNGEAFFHALYRDPVNRERLRDGMVRLGQWRVQTGVPVTVAILPVFLTLEDYPFADLHQRIAELARANGLEVLDLYPAFRDAEERQRAPLNADPLHPNARGYGLLGRRLADHLAEAS